MFAPLLPPGTVLAGRFTLQRLEGRGGMGLVYQAWDGHTGRTVALKPTNPEVAFRFTREAQILSW